MIFKTPEELVEFFNNLDLNKSTLVFKNEEKPIEEGAACACGGSCGGECSCGGSCGGDGACQCSTQTTESVTIDTVPENILVESLSDSPAVKLRLSESGEDIFYVNNYDSIPDACGTGMIELPDRKSYMNMCEMDGVASVDLNIIIEGQRLSVKFQLAKTEDEPYIVLNKKHINS